MASPARRTPAPAPVRLLAALAGAILLLALGSLNPPGGLAQNVIEATSPSATAPASASPAAVSVTFTTPIAAAAPASLVLLDSAGQVMPLGPAAAAADAPSQLVAPVLAPLPPGTYAALWSVQLAGDAAPRAGSFGFTVGATPAVPGGVTELAVWPAPWAVLARALVIIGLGGVLAAAVLGSVAGGSPRFARWLAAAGGALALAGALGLLVPGIVAGLPGAVLSSATTGGTALVVASAIALLAALLWNAASLARSLTTVLRALLIVAAVAGLLAAGWWSIAVPLLPGQPLTAAALVALPLLAGCLVACAVLAGVRVTLPAASPPLARIAWAGLIGGIVAAILALWLIRDDLGALGNSTFVLAGSVLLVLFLIGIVLALLSRRLAIARRLWLPVAVLTAVPLAVVGLTAPLAAATDMAGLVAVDLVAPEALTAASNELAHLVFQPATPGENAFAAYLTAADGAPLPPAAADLRLTALSAPAATSTVALSSLAETPFVAGAGLLPNPGWWQADLLAADGEPAATFVLLAPDPNVTGAGPMPAADPAAAAIFENALTRLTGLRNVQFTVDLGSGLGTHGATAIAINTGGNGQVPSYQEQSSQYEAVIVGDRQWVRLRDEEWQERPAGRINTPANWGITYEHATGFQFGATVPSPAEPLQVITFYTPRQFSPRQEPAWFVWWVGTETGNLHQEAMISTQHYMVYRYAGFDEPVTIVPPVATPVDDTAGP